MRERGRDVEVKQRKKRDSNFESPIKDRRVVASYLAKQASCFNVY